MASFGTDKQEEKALQHIADGEKCLKKWSLFSGSNKNEDAAECFNNAARCYKVARNMEKAADWYERAASQFETAGSNHEASRAYVEAAKCRKTCDSAGAVETFRKAINIFNETGRFQQAGRMLMEVGEIYEAEGDYASAVQTLSQAAEYLTGEGSMSQANTCWVKVAGMLSKDINPPELGRAAEIYETLGMSCLEKKLLQMNAKGYWLQAIFCLLARSDTVAARNKQDSFVEKDFTFDGSREHRFLELLIKSSEELDAEGFSQACYDYDQISKLDPWKTALCLRIKRVIQEGAGADEEDGDVDLT